MRIRGTQNCSQHSTDESLGLLHTVSTQHRLVRVGKGGNEPLQGEVGEEASQDERRLRSGKGPMTSLRGKSPPLPQGLPWHLDQLSVTGVGSSSQEPPGHWAQWSHFKECYPRGGVLALPVVCLSW